MPPTVLAVIPARYASTRLPGKPLALLAGRPMIQHVFDRVRRARSITRVLVATDDEKVLRAVQQFGGEAVLTRSDHRSGTERLAEVAVRHPADIYVNIQADEPLIEPTAIDSAVESLAAQEDALIATLRTRIRTPEDLLSPGVIKVVVDFDENALYFSRAPIPWVRESEDNARATHWKHLGIYLYRRSALLDYPALPPGELETLERLEQLRWLENGYKIRVFETTHDSIGVDTPEDLARVEKILASQPAEKSSKIAG